MTEYELAITFSFFFFSTIYLLSTCAHAQYIGKLYAYSFYHLHYSISCLATSRETCSSLEVKLTLSMAYAVYSGHFLYQYLHPVYKMCMYAAIKYTIIDSNIAYMLCS